MRKWYSIAPAIQVIFKNRIRINLAYIKPPTGNMLRINTYEIFGRLEYNI
jgi:hypothetical protein